MKLSKYPDKQVSVAAARTQLKQMLVNARSLDAFSPESLARMYRVPVRECETMLLAEQGKRQRLAADLPW